jgi:hypothetical protein
MMAILDGIIGTSVIILLIVGLFAVIKERLRQPQYQRPMTRAEDYEPSKKTKQQDTFSGEVDDYLAMTYLDMENRGIFNKD